jgi:hypothetical protein
MVLRHVVTALRGAARRDAADDLSLITTAEMYQKVTRVPLSVPALIYYTNKQYLFCSVRILRH